MSTEGVPGSPESKDPDFVRAWGELNYTQRILLAWVLDIYRQGPSMPLRYDAVLQNYGRYYGIRAVNDSLAELVSRSLLSKRGNEIYADAKILAWYESAVKDPSALKFTT